MAAALLLVAFPPPTGSPVPPRPPPPRHTAAVMLSPPWASRRLPHAIALRDSLLGATAALPADQIDALIDALAAARAPFDRRLLGGGLWRASYTRGRRPLWGRAQRLLPLRSNVAGQTFDVRAARVRNYAELLGPACHFVAEGSFAPAGRQGTRCPVDFNVQVERGGLVLFGRPLVSDAISGPGFLRVLYLDEDIRIFESVADSPGRWETAGLQVVQIREGCFADP
ncbi:hypothetical protein AB1Y20_010841 [Prymnesium parvum]|uniref:Plastid lipid-associated protein/fibrillin conserved domain-containing protein n=1 Tax=Prymnesium parvum TaxID=97485 RepID=A0AB34IQV3_PRYPA